MTFRLLFLIFIIGVRYSYSGILDSVSYTPPLISIEQAEAIADEFKKDFEHFCSKPATILHYYSDSTCYSHVQANIERFSKYDSLTYDDFKIAMYTYDKFGAIRKPVKKVYEFSHDVFLQYLEEEEDLPEKHFFIKWLDKISNLIYKYIINPLYSYFVKPIAKLGSFWKFFFIVLSIIIVLTISLILGKFIARIYPDISPTSNKNVRISGARNLTADEWLKKAKAAIEIGETLESVECLYRYLLRWITLNDRVRRYEWWTNRQLIKIIKRRFPNDYDKFSEIIYKYELAVYGHITLTEEDVREMIKSASTLIGVRVK